MVSLSQLKEVRLIQLCVAISFFTSGLIINLMQLTLFLCIKPFNKRLFRKLMYYLGYSLHSQMVWIADWWANCKLYVYMDEDDLKQMCNENVILMMNHSYEIDWLMGWSLCEKSRILGESKACVKKIIQYIPVIGWSWKLSGFVFLERSFEKDREVLNKQIKELFDCPDPVWLLLNAEGTRFTPEKHKASIKFARERGMPELKHHLIPRTKGFTSSLPSLRGRCPVILDINISFKKDDPVAPTISNLVFGRSVTAYMYIRRLLVDEVPEKEEEAAEWLQNLFREKDKIQDSFHTHGNYFTSSGFKETKCFLQKRRLYPLLNLVGWAIVTLPPMLYYLIKLFLNGDVIYFSIPIAIFTTFYLLMQKTIGMATISTASTYGANASTK